MVVRPCRENVRVKEDQARITVQVQPNASENKVARFEGGVWHLKIAAPPVKGKANRELIKFLGDVLGVSKSNLTIEKGLTSKRKVVTIEGMTQEEVRAELWKRLDC